MVRANFSMLQDSLLHWIRNDDNMVICLSTGDGNVQINNELATPENDIRFSWSSAIKQTDNR